MNYQEQAKLIRAKAAELGFSVVAGDGIVSVVKTFAPGDRSAFVECDGTYGFVLSLCPRTRAGSEWGTDGGSVGGLSALTSGRFVMNRSGVSKRLCAALAK